MLGATFQFHLNDTGLLREREWLFLDAGFRQYLLQQINVGNRFMEAIRTSISSGTSENAEQQGVSERSTAILVDMG